MVKRIVIFVLLGLLGTIECFQPSLPCLHIQLNHKQRQIRNKIILEETSGKLNVDSKDRGSDKGSSETSLLLPYTEEFKAFFEAPKIEIIICGLILLTVFTSAIDTLPNLAENLSNTVNSFQDVILVVFALEFCARWYATKLSVSHLFRPLSLIDIGVVIVPLALKLLPHISSLPEMTAESNGLTNLLLLRILSLQRVIQDSETFSKFIVALGLKPTDIRPYQLQLARVILSIFTLLSVSTGLIYATEHKVNPDIPDAFTALYFGLTTLTTVGFGDITPVTLQGKLVVCGSILAGVAIIPTQTASLVDAYLEFQQERKEQKRKQEEKAKKCALTFSRDLYPEFYTSSNDELKIYQDAFADEDDKEIYLVDISKECSNCSAKSHRYDAKFCWNCGNDLKQDFKTISISSKETRIIQ